MSYTKFCKYIFYFATLVIIYLVFPFEGDPEKTFTSIYKNNVWKVGSGHGSIPANARPYLQLLTQYLNDPNINTIVDLGCGDWQLMETVSTPDSKTYIGFDVVKGLIEAHKVKYGKNNISFHHIRSLKDFKAQKGDLLIVKDAIQHWPNKHIHYFIENILPNFKYALITNGYIMAKANSDIKLGQYRPLDLQAKPFEVKNLIVLLDYEAHGEMKRVYLYKRP